MTTDSTPFMRPLRLAELLDQAIRLYRNNFLKFIGIIAIPYIPLVLLQTGTSILTTGSLISQADSQSPEQIFQNSSYWVGIAGSIFISILQFFLVQGVATAALTRAVADNYIGRPAGILDAYQRVGKAWLRLILALLLMLVISLLLLIWLIIPCVGWLTGPGILFFVALVVTPLIAPVVVLENRGVGGSLRRAWDLARSRFWWLIGFAFVLSLFAQLVITGPTLLMNLLIQLVSPGVQLSLQQQMIWTQVVQTLIAMIGSLLYLPLQLTSMTVVYFDLRVRAEGLDLALQVDSPAGAEAVPAPALPEISSQSRAAFISGTDIGYFVLLTLAAVAVYVLFTSVLFGLMMLILPGLGTLQ